MNFYIVKLTIFVESYEKTTIHAIEAENIGNAVEQAYRDESHNDEARYIDHGSNWLDLDIIYTLKSVHKITESDYQELARILNNSALLR